MQVRFLTVKIHLGYDLLLNTKMMVAVFVC